MAVGKLEENDQEPKKIVKKKSLPPLTDTGGDGPPKKRKPRKKPVEGTKAENLNASSNVEQEQEKPAPRRRRKRSPSQGGDKAAEEAPSGATSPTRASGAPRKKKKKPKPVEAEAAQEGEVSTPKDGQGSKTSLISKDGQTTPRKKIVKKKKKTKKAAGDEDEFGDSPWAEDLKTMAEDIVTGDGKEEEEEMTKDEYGDETVEQKTKPVMSMLSAPILRSQPLDKIFIETSNKFKGQNKTTLAKQRAEEETKAAPLTVEIARTTTIDFAIGSHRIFRVVTLFLHGLVAGLCIWQAASVFTLTDFSDEDFLEHYYEISMPLQCSLYFLLALITVSVCDRFDVGNPTRRFVLRALTMQNGTVSLVFCLLALIVNIVLIRYDDKMYLYKDITDIFSSDSERGDDIRTFRSLCLVRCVFLVLSWLVLSITPNSDRLGKSLRSGETGLEREMELEKVSAA